MKTKLAILSDIHGNLPALEAVVEDAQKHGAEMYLVAGDLFLGAPFPCQTLELLQQFQAVAILGNHEAYLLDYLYQRGEADMQTSARWSSMRWASRQLGPTGLDYLEQLAEQAVIDFTAADSMRMVHGSLKGYRQGLIPDNNPSALANFQQARLWSAEVEPPSLADQLADLSEPVLVCGHTHIPWHQRVNGKLVLNPGAVGMPIHGCWKAQYSLLTWKGREWQIDQRSLIYDRERAKRAYFSSGLLEQGGAFARACLCNLMTGHNTAWFLILHILAVLKQDRKTFANMTNADWENAAASFPWDQYEDAAANNSHR
jgi:predicted phosphodiesterase